MHPDDLGKVIGRGGRTATAFRTVISALAGRGGSRIDFVDVDRRAMSASCAWAAREHARDAARCGRSAPALPGRSVLART